MGIFKNIFSKKKKDVIVETQTEGNITSYEDEPVKAASIVINGIESGQFSDISNKLGKLPSTGFCRTKYVFAAPKTTMFSLSIAVCICFMSGYLYFAMMGIGMNLYSDEYEISSMLFIGTAIAVVIINFVLIARSINAIKFVKRYEKYVELFKYKNLQIIDDINNYTKIGYSHIVRDLSNAINQKLIPEGHFTSENLVFIVSDELYTKYKENKPVYDYYYKKMIEERMRIEERSEQIQKIMDIGQEYIDKIHDSNRLIKDKNITEKLNKMEKIVVTIFREVDINPGQYRKLGMFLNYYLPTTEKLLSTYIDIAEKENKGTSIKNAQKDIERGLDMLIVSFEGILNQFYEEQELDIASEVFAMETIIAEEKDGR